MDGAFIPGVRLAGEFYAEAVRPLLDERYTAGAADQFIDNTNALGDLRRVRYQIEICPS